MNLWITPLHYISNLTVKFLATEINIFCYSAHTKRLLNTSHVSSYLTHQCPWFRQFRQFCQPQNPVSAVSEAEQCFERLMNVLRERQSDLQLPLVSRFIQVSC